MEPNFSVVFKYKIKINKTLAVLDEKYAEKKGSDLCAAL
jgi:hypothetical protein